MTQRTRRTEETDLLQPVRKVEKPWGYELVFAHTDLYAGKILHDFARKAEVFALKKSSGVDEDAMDVLVLTSGMVDPPLTEAEVREWRAVAAAGAVEPVMQAILRLSGLGEGAPKSVAGGVPEGQ